MSYTPLARLTLFLCLLAVISLQAAPQPLILWYDSDAGTSFTDAIPIGNGYMGAMIYGGVSKDVIGLNEGTVWNGSPGNNNKSGAAQLLQQARDQIFAGNYTGADATVSKMIGSEPARYQPVGNLYLNFSGHQGSHYYRELDLKTAIAKTTYTYNGVQYTREYFASYPDHAIVIRLTADQAGQISFSASMDTPHGSNSQSTSGNNLLLLNATVNAIKFQNRLQVTHDGGTISAANNKISVSGANSATLTLTIASNFKSYNDVSGNPNALTSSVMQKISGKTYDQLRQTHLEDYQKLFNRVSLSLGSEADNPPTTDLRVARFNTTNDPGLVRLYYQFGRYLMISCSRPGGQPANLQGIWNKDLYPSWGSKYTTNINLEMNYWMTETANLPECALPLIDKTKAMVPQGELTAQTHWGVHEGWVLHHNTDLWNRTAPIDGQWGHWPSGAGWLSTHLWEHYLFDQNLEYLADVYPTLKGAAQFFLNSMVTEPVSGNNYLVTVPSTSPELAHSGFWTCFAPTMDIQIIRDVFRFTVRASELLKLDATLRSQIQEAITHLPPHQIGQHGQLQEWFQDWDDPRSDHRHVSHLYGLFPSNQISVDYTSDLANAAKTTLTQRGDLATGWSLAWKINLWARLQDGDHAYELIRLLLTPERTYNNLFDAHPPFQIDGNFGAVSGINEMLVQSQHEEIQLLPALPSRWSNGNITGIRARGGFSIDSMAWNNNQLTYVSITSQHGGKLSLKYNGIIKSLSAQSGKTYGFDAELNMISGTLEPTAIPARIQAEDFTTLKGAKIESDEQDNLNMGWIQDGSWADYVLKVPQTGHYIFRVSVATGMDVSNTITIQNKAGETLGSITIDPAQTDDWHDWYVDSTNISLQAGTETLRLDFSGSSDYLFNFDWFELSVDPTAIPSPRPTSDYAMQAQWQPYSQQLSLSVQAPANEIYTVALYNLIGVQIAASKPHQGNAQVELHSNMPLSKSIYYVVLSGNRERRLVQKIMPSD